MARERNKIQHFAISIDVNTIKVNLIQLYGKVIKPCFSLLNYVDFAKPNSIGEKLEELYNMDSNAEREAMMLKLNNESFERGSCYNCDNYSLFLFYDQTGYPTRFHCTSCPHDRTEIEISDFRECPDCNANSLVFDDVMYGGTCLNMKCLNQRDGGLHVDMEPCDNCNDFKIENKCHCK